jgi:hypothetical protein
MIVTIEAREVFRVKGHNLLAILVGDEVGAVLIPKSAGSCPVDNIKEVNPDDLIIQQRWLTTTQVSEEFGVPLSTVRLDMKKTKYSHKSRGRWEMPYIVARKLYAGGRKRGLL